MGEQADTAPETAHHAQHTHHQDTTLHTNTAIDKKIMFVASLCTRLWLTPSFTSHVSHKGSGPDWLLSPRPHVKRVSRGGGVVVVVMVVVSESALCVYVQLHIRVQRSKAY